ncbi:ATP-grasp domain-containing protein [Kitasatospora kifunensis]|uniref:Biotin carboxylase n=1 Tax=Kitasatospora kifunensis TaxID=58351 RepID=A0A7W7R6X3_KITKI|nr:ATP-grasp domain-containing protein [Kitasatospora kifunensis]MBB4925976.1 biotin carboxylase [Kitasatospora kifunensis]
MIVIVNVRSSGESLAEILGQRGLRWVNLHEETSSESRAVPGAEQVIVHHDLAESVERLRSLSIDAVLPGSESGVTLANELAAALGLAHNAPELAAARRDKLLMAQAVEAYGLPGPRTRIVHTAEELDSLLAEWDSYPVVVKPASSAGSDGIAIAYSADLARAAFETLHGTVNRMHVRNDGVVVQEYLKGTLFIVNTVSANGVHVVTDVYEKRIDELDGRPVCRHLLLRKELDDFEESAVKYTFQCLDALGLRNGAAHTELMKTESGPRLVEVNSRLMGPAMPSDVFVPSLGYSQATMLLDRYLNESGFLRQVDSPYAPQRYLAQAQLRTSRSGVIRAMPGLDAIRALPGFLAFGKLPTPGRQIADPLLTTAANGICYFSHQDEAVLRASLDQLHQLEDAEAVFDLVPNS